MKISTHDPRESPAPHSRPRNLQSKFMGDGGTPLTSNEVHTEHSTLTRAQSSTLRAGQVMTMSDSRGRAAESR